MKRKIIPNLYPLDYFYEMKINVPNNQPNYKEKQNQKIKEFLLPILNETQKQNPTSFILQIPIEILICCIFPYLWCDLPWIASTCKLFYGFYVAWEQKSSLLPFESRWYPQKKLNICISNLSNLKSLNELYPDRCVEFLKNFFTGKNPFFKIKKTQKRSRLDKAILGYGSIESIKELESTKKNIFKHEEILSLLASKGRWDVFKERNHLYKKQNYTKLYEKAIKGGNEELIHFLKEKTEDKNSLNVWMSAIKKNRTQIIEELKRNSKNYRNTTVLEQAVSFKNIPLVDWLLDQGCLVSRRTFFTAIKTQQIEIVQKMISHASRLYDLKMESTVLHTRNVTLIEKVVTVSGSFIVLDQKYIDDKIFQSFFEDDSFNYVFADGDIEWIQKILLSKNLDSFHLQFRCFMSALTRGNFELLEFLINKKNIPLSDRFFEEAILYASTRMLFWLKYKKCPWNKSVSTHHRIIDYKLQSVFQKPQEKKIKKTKA